MISEVAETGAVESHTYLGSRGNIPEIIQPGFEGPLPVICAVVLSISKGKTPITESEAYKLLHVKTLNRKMRCSTCLEIIAM
jgi:hypothetical protein